MQSEQKLIIHSRDLPLPLEIQGENGEREIYMLTPAGRKFGACLTKVPDMLRRLLL
jgi:predicted transcriptional regulator